MTDITVLVGTRVHPVSGRAVRSRADAVAATLALGVNAQARLLTAGTMPDAVARDYLALGAARIDVLDGVTPAGITTALADALRAIPWVLTGTRQGSEPGEGVLPHALAVALNRPVITDVLAIEADGEAWIVTQALPRGARRRLRVQAPAVLAVSASAPVTLRHALASAQAGRIVRQAATAAASASPDSRQAVPAGKRRKVLEARTRQSGHARMLGAIDSPSTGGAVLQAGDARSKAQALLDYLRSHSLVDF
jgi:electron transfer flavoprotein beta subunit